MSIGHTLKREARVALSLKAQSLRFRIVKWVVALAVGALLWRTPYFWWVLGIALCLSLSLHLMWRWKTRNWTQPWGGWDDVETAGKD